jgi:hypothetical protein
MGAIFSSPKAPKVKTLTPEQIAANDVKRTNAAQEAVRASILERKNNSGRQALVQPGLVVPL